jgi:23S rRNA (guanosine2251-2'-O)-methyltransferase
MAMSDSELVYGIHAISAALEHQPGTVLEAWLDRRRKDKRIDALSRQLERSGVQVHTLNKNELDDMAQGQRHQGAVARVRLAKSGNEKDLESILNQTDQPFLLILDGVTDPHNLGACLRSADAAGVHAVIAPKDNAASLTATARKVASGAAETVPFIQVTNLSRTMKKLQDAGVWIVGLAGETEQELYNIDLKGPLALAMGAEGKGLRRLTREHCDHLVRIPMVGTVESLNVSVATGICLFEALRQRVH